MTDPASLADSPVSTRAKLAALWAATMFCYIYADFFALFQKGRLDTMNAGQIGPLGEATNPVMLGVSMMMAVPSLMVALTLLLPVQIARWANVIWGLAFAAIQALTASGAESWSYLFFTAVEVPLTLVIAGLAWRWPRSTA